MKPKFSRAVTLFLALLLSAGTGAASANTLYDAALGTLPSAQGWVFAQLPSGAAQTVSNGHYRLDTTASQAIRAGNLRSGLDVLNTVDGFELAFRLRVDQESHASSDRAGFSLLAIGQNAAKALEIGFWTDSVWVYDYDGTFKRGASYALDTTAEAVDYRLRVVNDQFTLSADGVPALAGAMKDYTAAAVPLSLTAIYATPNTLFFGDDTGSADSRVDLASMSLHAVPLPDAACLMASSVLGLVGLRRRRRNLA